MEEGTVGPVATEMKKGKKNKIGKHLASKQNQKCKHAYKHKQHSLFNFCKEII